MNKKHKYHHKDHITTTTTTTPLTTTTTSTTTPPQRREVMVCAPTGSGKTMAFAIPLLHLLHQHDPSGFRSLILTPTHELALQVFMLITSYYIFCIN